jgi:lysophospholipase L1-like esterase
MARSLAWLLPLLLVVLIAPATSAEPAAGFPLKDGDVWVMAGDSITAQHMHSNYFEAFCFARYPQMKFAFRNSGVGGHTIPSTLDRFNYDIAVWKPTIVSVELGMNDKGGTPTDKFLANMKTMVDRIRSIEARPVILSASPVNNGETSQTLGGGNQRLDEYATQLKPFCAEEKIPYADQFHALLDIWGQNKPREMLSNSLAAITQLSQNNGLEGVEHLKAFLAVQAKNPHPPVSMQGDPVHPGYPGQLMMAAALLKELGADGFVSSAKINAAEKTIEAKDCQVDGLSVTDTGIAFDRLDARFPFPIPQTAREVVPMYPVILELSQYMLTVQDLKEGNYTLKINTVALGTFSSKQLSEGINLTDLDLARGANPIASQANLILNAVVEKEGLVSRCRALSQRAHAADATAEMKSQLATEMAGVEQADEAIRAAAKPKAMHFELIRNP